MKIEEINDASMEEIEKRAGAIIKELENADEETLKTLSKELDAIEARKAAIKDEQKKAADDADAVANGSGVEIRKLIKEKKTMTIKELRNSQKYVDAFARYIKSGSDKELRTILTENADSDVYGENDAITDVGTLPVPDVVSNVIETAWNELKVLNKCKYVSVKGNLRVGFEAYADGAQEHLEGDVAPDQEKLLLGIAKLVPSTIKKWVTWSTEAEDMDSVGFLTYIYQELTHQIFKKAEIQVLNDIMNAPAYTDVAADVDLSEASVYQVTLPISIDVFVKAASKLSDAAHNPCIIMNRETYGYFKALAMNASYSVDPFDGMEVIFTDYLSDVSTATTNGDPFCIIGDLSAVTTNFPNGKSITFKYDDLSLAELDLVKLVGRTPFSCKVTAPQRLAVVTGSTEEDEDNGEGGEG